MSLSTRYDRLSLILVLVLILILVLVLVIKSNLTTKTKEDLLFNHNQLWFDIRLNRTNRIV